MQWLQDTFTAFSTTESNTDTTDNKHAEIPESGTLQRDGKLSSRQLLDFFRTASEIMQSEEFRRKLKDARLLKQVSSRTNSHGKAKCYSACCELHDKMTQSIQNL